MSESSGKRETLFASTEGWIPGIGLTLAGLMFVAFWMTGPVMGVPSDPAQWTCTNG